MSWDLSSEEVICEKLENQQRTIFAFSKKIKELEAKASILVGALEEISKSTYEANPWTIVKTQDAETADKALLKYKGIDNDRL
jgi:hypothetical protein